MGFELTDTYSPSPIIKVVGIGGAGGNAIERMLEESVQGVDMISVNTDSQALKKSTAPTAIQIGTNITKGLGAGAKPEKGKEAAMEDRDRLKDLIEGTNMLFITAGMGGGTGTGASPVIAELAKEMGILTVAVVTKPFEFENRDQQANDGLEDLRQHVDSMITIPNEKLFSLLDDPSMKEALLAADGVLQGAVQGIADLITNPGIINVDFADVDTVMSGMGQAMMGTGVAEGKGRAKEATDQAISSPLLDDVNLAGAKGILVNITATSDMKLSEFKEVGDIVKSFAAEDAKVVIGTAFDEEMGNEFRVTVVATGLSDAPVVAQATSAVTSTVPEVTAKVTTPTVEPVQPTIEKTPEPVIEKIESVAMQQNAVVTSIDSHRAVKQEQQVEIELEQQMQRDGTTDEILPFDHYKAKPVIPQPDNSIAVAASQHTQPTDYDSKLEYLNIPAFLRKQAD